MNTICNLNDQHCVPCEGSVDPLDRETADTYLDDLPGWSLSIDGKMISRRFEFRGFLSQFKLNQSVQVFDK